MTTMPTPQFTLAAPWTGGDSTASTPIPDGRVAWLFSDTMLGTVNPDGTRDTDTPMIRNSLIVQAGDRYTLHHGGTDQHPDALIHAPHPGQWVWIGAPIHTRGKLTVLVNTYRPDGAGMFGFRLSGSGYTRIDPDHPARTVATPYPFGAKVAWGSAIVEHRNRFYVYGSEYDHQSGRRWAHLARTYHLEGSAGWKFWTGQPGRVWTADPTKSARLVGDVGTAFGVQQTSRGWVLVTVDSPGYFTGTIVARHAPNPWGPWSAPAVIFDAPEASRPGRIIYDARLHPHMGVTGELDVSYNVHSLDASTLFSDASVYRPRFIKVFAV